MVYFSKIKDPETFRRNLLEVSRDVVLLHKKDVNIVHVRNKKKILNQEIDANMKSIKSQINRLMGFLTNSDTKSELASKAAPVSLREIYTSRGVPETLPSFETKSSAKSDSFVADSEDKKVEESQRDSELDRLEYTLQKIEDKIKSL